MPPRYSHEIESLIEALIDSKGETRLYNALKHKGVDFVSVIP